MTATAESGRRRANVWAKARRERTRHLIELGGLVQKAGLVDLAGDDRATLLGACLDLADPPRHGRMDDNRSPQQVAAVWRRRGLLAFDADAAASAAKPVRPETTAGLSENEARECCVTLRNWL